MTSQLPSDFEQCKFVLFTEGNAPALQHLLERCPDYFEIVEGRPAGPSAAMGELTDMPPEMPADDLLCMGVRKNLNFVAVLIALRNFRRHRQWYISLLLLDPRSRRRGLGHKINLAFESWIIAQGADSVLLAVVDTNPTAKSFWTSLGYKSLQTFENVSIGLRRHTLIEYEKLLKPKL